MKKLLRAAASISLAAFVFLNNLPHGDACGPGYLTPVFDYKYAPENPFDDFASGKIGIIKPSYHRVVLFAAYRYLNGGSFTANEQKALVDVWNADFNNKDYADDDVSEAVKLWLERRKEVAEKEEKPPEIYAEREYQGGYSFFPNCTKNAFETAAATLADRIASYGATDENVKDWVAAQDAVFTNCASGVEMPAPPNQTMPEWLQKDRAYQRAAAEFYALDYENARRDFAEISRDTDSVWRETANYLVARTLIRQASMTDDEKTRNAFYAEAETQIETLSSAAGGKYADSIGKYKALIKYRLHPETRVGELAQKLSVGAANDNFRQDLIDYYWLLDKFEKEILEKEEKRKEELNKNAAKTAGNSNVAVYNLPDDSERKGLLKIYLSNDDYSKSWTVYFKPGATDEEAFAEAERVAGSPLTEKMKAAVRSGRRTAYSNLYSESAQPEYEGGYHGDEKTSLSILPDFLRRDDLTEWLFVYQSEDAAAYDYAHEKYKQTGANIWLMTAIAKADANSAGLKNLLEAANRIGRFDAVYPTVAFHEIRILIDQGKRDEAKKRLDEILNSADNLPVSTRNQFVEQRNGLAETLDDFLRDALKTPFAFDSDGETGTIAEFISREKSYYDPEYDKETREEYDRKIDDQYRDEIALDGEPMLDDEAAKIINEHFPSAALFKAIASPALPDYLKKRFSLAVWTRAVLTDDYATADKIAPLILKLDDDAETIFAAYLKAKTPAAKRNASLFIILKNEKLTPYISSGLGSPYEGYLSGASRWWCEPYTTEYDETAEKEVPLRLTAAPKFLTAADTAAAQAEIKKLKTIGDAPKFLGTRVLDWARRAPADKRVPESLYIVYEANGWDKYGCGNNEELRTQIGDLLKKRYPQNEWTQKILDEEKSNEQ